MTSRRLLAASVLLVAGCSSPAPKFGGGGERPVDALHPAAENPFREPSDVRSRNELVDRFFAARGITIAAAAESEWVALGDEAAVVVLLRNGGTKPLTIVGERTTGIWPFRSTERARAVLHVAATSASARSGVQTTQDALPVEALATIVVPPGSECSLRLPLALPQPEGLECLRVVVRPVLHPLAVVVGDEPERVITLRLGDVAIGFAPPDVAAADALVPEGADVPATLNALLERALAERPGEVIAAAVRCAAHDLVGTVERLLLALPGPDVRARRARCVALEWITGVPLGDQVERWRSWWESAEGARFRSDAAAQRP